MTTIHRALLAVLFAAWLAMPSVGDEGGENASGGGVWILPCAAVIDETAIHTNGSAQRGQLAAHAVAADIRMQVASNMGTASAVLVTPLSSDPLPLAVEGSCVVIPRELLQTLAVGKTCSRILIVDALQSGYVIDMVFDVAGSAVTLSVR